MHRCRICTKCAFRHHQQAGAGPRGLTEGWPFPATLTHPDGCLVNPSTNAAVRLEVANHYRGAAPLGVAFALPGIACALTAWLLIAPFFIQVDAANA